MAFKRWNPKAAQAGWLLLGLFMNQFSLPDPDQRNISMFHELCISVWSPKLNDKYSTDFGILA
jgi:hypothetical protein